MAGGCFAPATGRPPRERELAETLAELRRATADAEQARLAGESARHQDALVDHLEAQVRAHARRASGRPWTGTGSADPHGSGAPGRTGRRRPGRAGAARRPPDGCHGEPPTQPPGRLGRRDPGDRSRRGVGVRGPAARRRRFTGGARPLRGDVAQRGRIVGHAPVRPVAGGGRRPSRRARPDRRPAVGPLVVASVVDRSPDQRRALGSDLAQLDHRGGRDGTEVVALAGPGLAAADREVREVARTRGARAVTGRDATAAAALSAMATADTVHIAAHGRLRTDNPMLSALEMADGPLTIYDLEQLDATARLVLLPACRSGQPSVHAGDEVMGLAQALLALGSQTVVATVVPVPDEATHPLMVDLHARLAAGAQPAEALAAAQRAVGTHDPAARAAAAGFVCFGDG